MSFSHLSTTDLVELQKMHEEVMVLDIRDPDSFASGHIAKAIHLSNDNASEVLPTLDPSAALVVCCYHGHSSQPVAQWLSEQGFEQVFSLDGGYAQWALTQADR